MISSFLKSLREQLERRRGGHPDDLKKPFEDATGINPLDPASFNPYAAEMRGSFNLSPQEQELIKLRAQVANLERLNGDLYKGMFDLHDYNVRLKHHINDLRAQLRMAQQYPGMASPSPLSIPEFITKHLRFLIFVCHPDRNPGKAEAAEVTRELLALRGNGGT